jgi:hypothetical protein
MQEANSIPATSADAADRVFVGLAKPHAPSATAEPITVSVIVARRPMTVVKRRSGSCRTPTTCNCLKLASM